MRNELEFHDSMIVSIAQVGKVIHITLNGYLHRWDKSSGVWKGEGWRQPVLITMTGDLPTAQAGIPAATLETGDIELGEITYTHLVPLPLSSAGPAALRLETAEGEVLEFSGSDLKAETTGAGTFVEKLPDEFKPVG